MQEKEGNEGYRTKKNNKICVFLKITTINFPTKKHCDDNVLKAKIIYSHFQGVPGSVVPHNDCSSCHLKFLGNK